MCCAARATTQQTRTIRASSPPATSSLTRVDQRPPSTQLSHVMHSRKSRRTVRRHSYSHGGIGTRPWSTERSPPQYDGWGLCGGQDGPRQGRGSHCVRTLPCLVSSKGALRKEAARSRRYHEERMKRKQDELILVHHVYTISAQLLQEEG